MDTFLEIKLCSKFNFIIFQYGKDYDFDAPVKLLDKHLHGMAESVDEQLVVVSQVSYLFFLFAIPVHYFFPQTTPINLCVFFLHE